MALCKICMWTKYNNFQNRNVRKKKIFHSFCIYIKYIKSIKIFEAINQERENIIQMCIISVDFFMDFFLSVFFLVVDFNPLCSVTLPLCVWKTISIDYPSVQSDCQYNCWSFYYYSLEALRKLVITLIHECYEYHWLQLFEKCWTQV